MTVTGWESSGGGNAGNGNPGGGPTTGWENSGKKSDSGGFFSDIGNGLSTVGGYVGGGIKTGLDILGAPGRAVLSAARASIESDKNYNNESTLQKILGTFSPHQLSAAFHGAVRGATNKENLSPTEAIFGRGTTAQQAYGSAGTLQGILGRAADFTASVATDPTVIIGGGADKAIQEGGTHALGETAAKLAAKEGEPALAGLARQSVFNIAKEKGAKAAIEAVGGKEAVKATAKQAALDSGLNPRRSLVDLLKGTPKTSEAYAEKFSNKAVKSLARSQPDAIERQLTKLGLSNATAKDVITKLANNPVGREIQKGLNFGDRLVSNVAKDTQDFGKKAAPLVSQARRDQVAEKYSVTKDLQTQLNAGLKGAGFKSLADVPKESDAAIRTAIEKGTRGRAALEQANPELLPLHDALKNTLTANAQTKVSSGLLKADEVIKNFAPRQLTPAAEKAFTTPGFTKLLQTHPELGDLVKQGGKATPRGLLKDSAVSDLNAKYEPVLQKAGLLKSKEHLFEPGIVEPTLNHLQSTTEKVAQTHYLNNLSKITDDTGSKLIYKGTAPGTELRNIPKGYQKVNGGPLGTMLVHPKLANEVTKVRDVITNNEDLKKIKQAYGHVLRAYKVSATTLPVTGGFESKKVVNDVFMSYVAGMKNPASFIEGRLLNGRVGKVLKDPANSEALIAGKVDDVLKKGLSKADYSLIKAADKTGILGTSFHVQDLGDEARLTNKGNKVTKILGKPVKKSSDLFRGIDSNARLSLFKHELEHNGGNAEAAAATVRKYLFDYSDLTGPEKTLRNSVMPFYTFMRKNTPLQIEQMVHNTGKYTAASHLGTALGFKDVAPGTPNYAQSGSTPPAGLAKLLGLPANSTISSLLPTSASDAAIRPLTALPSLIPAIRDVLPTSYRAKDKADAARQLMSLLGGPLGGGINELATEATGKSTFSGATNKPGKGQVALRLLESVVPAAGRVESVKKQKARAALLKALTGITASANKATG